MNALFARIAGLMATHDFTHSFDRGSVAFWGNRTVQHYASSVYWQNKRVM